LTSFESVRQFHKAFDIPDRIDSGVTPWIPESVLRIDLLTEEFREYIAACEANDFIGMVDALGDMKYVIEGTAIAYGVNLDAVSAEIHRSNMTKLGEDGRPVYRADGKVIKGPHYDPPKLAKVLGLD
jgi:predicted HAD superfamily Cof-like phosphohydrolase